MFLAQLKRKRTVGQAVVKWTRRAVLRSRRQSGVERSNDRASPQCLQGRKQRALPDSASTPLNSTVSYRIGECKRSRPIHAAPSTVWVRRSGSSPSAPNTCIAARPQDAFRRLASASRSNR